MKSFQKALAGLTMSLLFIVPFTVTAQRSDRAITPTEQKELIDKAFVILKKNYIFPQKLVHMEATINKKRESGAYAKGTTVEDFLKNLNTDLETLSNDRHVNIFFDPVRVAQVDAEARNKSKEPAYVPTFLERAKYENYMVRKAERLDGNVGYLKFNSFVDAALSKPTLVAAMNFLHNSSALIIDLRQNGGGHATTCAFLLSYFLPDSTLLMQGRSRANNEVTKSYTVKDAAVQKFEKSMPLYILTSGRTSSAAEAFAYVLQAQRRAVIVGDTTNGEANPGYQFSLNSEMYMMVPAFESTNPITKTNWQGRGVVPDVAVAADKALTMAQAAAYGQLAATTTVKERKTMYDWMATGMMAEVAPAPATGIDLTLFAGDYADNRKISFKEGQLFYERTGSTGGPQKLVLLKEALFSLEGLPFFRVRFVKNEGGRVTGLQGLYDDGKEEFSKKL